MSTQEQQTTLEGGASVSTAMLGDWQPIETAPKDGTTVELLGENGELDIGEWCEFSEHFDKAAMGIADNVTGEFSTEYGEGPHTHWRHLSTNTGVTGRAKALTKRNRASRVPVDAVVGLLPLIYKEDRP